MPVDQDDRYAGGQPSTATHRPNHANGVEINVYDSREFTQDPAEGHQPVLPDDHEDPPLAPRFN